MARDKAPIAKLHELKAGQTAVVFALLAEKLRNATRDGKPFFSLRFKDAKQTVGAVVWADSTFFKECDASWAVGGFYKIRGTLAAHEKYGLQLELLQIRDVKPDDAADGFRDTDFYERSRFESDAMFAELRQLVEAEVKGVPLRTLIIGLLDVHAEALQRLPASPKHYYPFPGGWLEHTLNVARNCLWLADQYAARFPELTPPLNRDLVFAGAVLHDFGRVAEVTTGPPGHLSDATIPGRLLGHVQLGRDLLRDAAKAVPELDAETVLLLEHIVLTHLSLPEWGSPRLPMIPEVLLIHHADDLDAKFEMYARHLSRDASEGPFTDRDPILGKPLLKQRGV